MNKINERYGVPLSAALDFLEFSVYNVCMSLNKLVKVID